MFTKAMLTPHPTRRFLNVDAERRLRLAAESSTKSAGAREKITFEPKIRRAIANAVVSPPSSTGFATGECGLSRKPAPTPTAVQSWKSRTLDTMVVWPENSKNVLLKSWVYFVCLF